MMERLLVGQEEMKTGHKELLAKLEDDRRANMKAWREEVADMRDKWMNANQNEMLVCREKKPTSPERKPEAAEQREVPVQDATVMPVREPEEKMTSVTRKDMMTCRETTEARLEEEQPTSLDREPEVAQQQQVPKEDAVVQPVKRTEEAVYGQEASCRATWRAKGTDQRNLWTPDEVSCRLQKDVPSCNSGTTQEGHLQAEHEPPRRKWHGRWKTSLGETAPGP
jgi:hypothetical protein